MKSLRNFSKIAATSLYIFTYLSLIANFCEGQNESDRLVLPIKGARVLAGEGEVPDCVVQCFLHLCNDATPNVVVVNVGQSPRVSVDRWKALGADTVKVIEEIQDNDKQLLMSMLTADGIWFENGAGRFAKFKPSTVLLKNLAERNGVIGAAGDSAVDVVENRDWGLLKGSLIQLDDRESGKAKKETAQNRNLIRWKIPASTSLVVHHGRRVAAIGNENIEVHLAEKNGWSAREASIEAIDAFDPGDVPAYSLDLLSWQRSAIQRHGKLFPPPTSPTPFLEKGTLVLHGGSGVNDETFEQFIDAAGGKDAAIVCIPSAASFAPGAEPDSYSADRLRDLGCNNVVILHTSDPLVADQSRRFLALLRLANGVWIDGGRTYRMMDRFENTTAEDLMRKVLERGGVVGGSSAGCQVAGDFLVRGNPRTNRDLVYDGYTQGFGFVEGVVLDAHFLQRERGKTFLPLMKRFPQMLGIGVDENTALLIRGSTGKVCGENAISFYNMTAEENSGQKTVTILKHGDVFDLKKRIQVK